ncbi:MAG TPA: serine hydrolase domain-containing protein [Edaphocola sp.]|nr:serine hydrolase domain-containing protein [Edaphocola sp.]
MKYIPFIGIITSVLTLSFQACKAKSNETANPISNKNIVYADTNSIINKRIIDSLDRYYDNEVKRGFNGSVLIGSNGKVIYKRFFGYANRPQKELLDDNTSTQLSSTSKPFTATAILWLHQNKYLDINLPVNAYLKNFPYSNITVKMLLDHRSGLRDYTKAPFTRWLSKKPMYNNDLQNQLALLKPRLNYNPNTKFDYSNTNYALLARIIEEVSGMSYKQFLKELIFEPLGMNHTFVFDPADNYENEKLAISYKADWSVFANNEQDGVYGDKGIYSTPEDLYLWDQSFYKNRILNKNNTQLAYTGNSPEMRGNKNYGLGWRMYDTPDGQKMIFHNGWWHGNNSVFYRFVLENSTIIVLGNKYNKKIYDQGKAVYAILQSIAPQNFKFIFNPDEQGGE